MLRAELRTLNLLHLDTVRLTRTLDRVLGQIWRESAREWVRTILLSGVPVETGMAKAALSPIGRYLNRIGGLGISPTRNPYYSKLEGGIQEPAFGEAKTDFYIQDSNFVYEFYWETDVLHFWLSQYYTGKTLPGEFAVEIANERFLERFVEGLEKRLPNYGDYIFSELS